MSWRSSVASLTKPRAVGLGDGGRTVCCPGSQALTYSPETLQHLLLLKQPPKEAVAAAPFYLLKLFIYLTASGFHCSTWDIHWGKQASLAVVRGLSCPLACGILVPWPGMEPTPPALEGGLLTTGPPGQSQQLQFRDGNIGICQQQSKVKFSYLKVKIHL